MILYTTGDGAVSAAEAAISAGGVDHYLKNLAALLIASVFVVKRYHWMHVPVLLIPGAIAGNVYASFAFGGDWIGASGGTFVLLGVASVAAVNRFGYRVVLLSAPLVYHQLFVTYHATAAIHIVAFWIGVGYATVVESQLASQS